VIPWPSAPAESTAGSLPVPDVAGATVRQAALLLHKHGFRVDLRGIGPVVGTSPSAGEEAAAGATVIVWTGSTP
jgi:beta-lactam-binding protein with PASTA domain